SRSAGLAQERPARFLPGVDAALDVTGRGEARILRGLHRHGRTFAEGAIEDDALAGGAVTQSGHRQKSRSAAVSCRRAILWGTARQRQADSEQFRSAPRTGGLAYGRLSVPQTRARKPLSNGEEGRMFALRRREFLALVGSAAAAWPAVTSAQQGEKLWRIGVLVGYAEDDPEIKARLGGFRQGLERLGLSEGHNVRIDIRFAPGGAQAQMRAKELVALRPGCDRDARHYEHHRIATAEWHSPDRVRRRQRTDRRGLRRELVAT